MGGFTSGEGCFVISIYKSKTKLGEAVQLIFQLTQHERDEELIRNLTEYLGCGKISKNREAFDLKVTKLLDLNNKIIPFFKKYKILGIKSKNFNNFYKTAEIIQKKGTFN